MRTKQLFPVFWLMASVGAFAQDVPPPPLPETTNSALTPILESLKQMLLSTGRVEYGNNWQRITNVVVDSRGCQARMHYDSSLNGGIATDLARSWFFESIDTAEALSMEELHNRYPTATTYSTGAQVILVNGLISLYVASGANGSRIAESLTRAGQICGAMPVVPSSGPGAPSLTDTLQFIADKLNDNGAVNYRGSNLNSDGGVVGTPLSVVERITQASADPSTCQVRFNRRAAVEGNDSRAVISFRRVEKLEVGPLQDSINRARVKTGIAQPIYKTEPIVYRLSAVNQGGASTLLTFRDEEIANRLAKAMNHAVELCGGGNKDPF